MKEYSIEFPLKNWSAVDAAWKDEKRKHYNPPYQAAMGTELRSFLIPDFGMEPYFPNSSNPTLKEAKEYAKDVIAFINEKNLDIEEFEISAEACVYWREQGFESYEPSDNHAVLGVLICKLKKS